MEAVQQHGELPGRSHGRTGIRRFLPLSAEGGIVLPEKSQGNLLQATGVAVGSESKGKGREIQVLLLEYGSNKVVLHEEDYFLFRDSDIHGKDTVKKSLLKWRNTTLPIPLKFYSLSSCK